MHNETTTREKILKQVRKALIDNPVNTHNVDFASEIFTKSEEPLEIVFAQQFTHLNGKFIYCQNKKELLDNLHNLIRENKWESVFCFEKPVEETLNSIKIPFSTDKNKISKVNVGVSLCESLAARTGSVLLSSRQNSGRRLPAFANFHIVIAYSSQLVPSIKDSLNLIRKKYKTNFPSMIITVSGPSRTADIEKTLVQGAHGPKEIYVFLVDS